MKEFNDYLINTLMNVIHTINNLLSLFSIMMNVKKNFMYTNQLMNHTITVMILNGFYHQGSFKRL